MSSLVYAGGCQRSRWWGLDFTYCHCGLAACFRDFSTSAQRFHALGHRRGLLHFSLTLPHNFDGLEILGLPAQGTQRTARGLSEVDVLDLRWVDLHGRDQDARHAIDV